MRILLKIVEDLPQFSGSNDIAGNFIQKNPAQITKRLVSPKNITDPVIIYTYDGTVKEPECGQTKWAQLCDGTCSGNRIGAVDTV